MKTLLMIKDWFVNLLGFRRHDEYTKKYLNDANIRSSMYMAFVIIVLELWMIFRSSNKYVIPAVEGGSNFFDAFFLYTSLYWLFLLSGLAMLVFSIFYMVEKVKYGKNEGYNKRTSIIPIIFAGLVILYSFLIFKEIKNFVKWDVRYYLISNLGTIFLYVFALCLGLSIIWHTIYKLKHGENSIRIAVLIIVVFSMLCLAFGVKVGYTDFFSRFDSGTGLPRAKNGQYEIKSILCFLTMVIYMGCLLIWKPYISIAMLTGIFVVFGALLGGDPNNRLFADGERVNYITFLISLIMITISIYQQRISEAKKAQNLERTAKYDLITNVYNYRYFVNETQTVLKNLGEHIGEYYYLFINIQNFKTYNDQMGFKKGTEFLIRFAKKIEEIFTGFPCAREGDDHFVTIARIENISERIKQLEDFIAADANGLYLNLKVGAVKPYDVHEDINTSIDRARYAAGTIKNNYGKSFAEYDDRMHDSYKKKQYVINHLDEAIEKGYIKAYYQPVVWSNDKKLCGVEALCRWIDPKYGFLSPGEFIPTLEEVRLIHKLDTAVYEIVCKDLKTMIDEGKPVVPVSLNFSRLDFELMDVVTIFNDLVEKYNIPHELLHVEITESALTGNLTHLQQCLDKLRMDGYAIWLDDFGSGYSSLNVLKDFTFDVLKIDMKFLTNFEQKPHSKDILDMIVKLAEKLGMLTLTEGVETQTQADFLSEIGCGRLQGYLFGKPLPLEELIESIKTGKYVVSKEII